MATAKKQTIKYKNVAAALAIVLILILSISTACSHDKEENKKIDDSSVEETESKTEEPNLSKNFKHIVIENDKALGKGSLILVNEKNPFKLDEPENLDGVYGYLFDKEKNQICLASSTNVQGDKQLLSSFNAMMTEFNADRDIDNVVISSIYSGNSDNEKDNSDSPEHLTGYAIDLNIYNVDNGSYPVFKADGEYKWISENCWKFGFVQRFTADKTSITGVKEKTNHYRYVGQLNAEIMTKNNLCLEEYTEYLKKYSFKKPLEFQSENGAEYMLYYVPAGKDKNVKLPIPLNEDGTEYKYGYSGNNVDGYVVWVKFVDEVSYDSNSSESVNSQLKNSSLDSNKDSSNETSKTAD